MQIPGILLRRIVVVSGGASSASDLRAPRMLVAPAAYRQARKSRRFCRGCIEVSSLGFGDGMSAAGMAYAFSSRLSSLTKRQSVPSASSAFGLVRSMPASCRRSA
jgi:hypothetical protein